VIEYSEDLKFWLNLTDMTKLGGLAPEQNKKIADLILDEKPNIVLETGVFAGSSTVTILEALKQLNNGILYSIDDMSLIKKFTCCYITEDLKSRWIFIKDKSQHYLSSLKDDFIIDIFLHDSEHTYDNMRFEYFWAMEHVKSNGWVVSHDTHDNKAWDDFCEKIKCSIVDSFKIHSLAGVKVKK